MPLSFKNHLVKLLLQDSRFVDEQGELQGNVIKDCVNKLDEKLIETLLNTEQTRDKFFLKVKEVYVFKANDFKFYLEENSIDNSFTQYSNRIGLTLNGKYLKDNTDVVLDFPYKDCILEGGQSTEEGLDTYFEFDEKSEDYVELQSKRKEIFYNTILAKDEIDRLFEPKAFANIKRYDKDGESIPASFNRNKEINRSRNLPEDTITDNLLIKGNNLLALHSMESEFKNKVKLIYIDPPYNTGNDSFSYNDNFNHSTWLTFMLNRLQIAKSLLRNDGIICVQCDDNENAYLKVLLDDVFKDGFLNNVAVKMSEASGVKMNHVKTRFPKLKEYILLYKMPDFKGFIMIDKYEQKEWDKENNIFIENLTKEQRDILLELEIKDINDENDVKIANKILSKAKKKSLSVKLNEMKFENENEISEWLFSNSYRIIKTAGTSSLANLVKKFRDIPKQDIASAISKTGVLFFYITDFNRETTTPRLQVIFADNNLFKNPCDFWQDIKTTGAISDEGGVKLSNGKKPEKILHRLIKMITDEYDIVLDYHLGSGTTASVAQKMNRQFIGCEQMDNQMQLSIERLNNVINGDSTGISNYEDVNWQGGGSFIYMELAKNNQNAKEQINECKNHKELIKLFDTLCNKYFLHYNVRINEFKNTISKEENFKKLSLERQKEIFCLMLDNNQLYVHSGEMEDRQYSLSKDDIRLTKDFYQI
jgi:adenine-specific DNA-methyltransferase